MNYSWAYSGLWSIARSAGIYSTSTHTNLYFRHILPESAPSRIFFPTQANLVFAMTPAAVPKGKKEFIWGPNKLLTQLIIDYGGTLPFLTDLDDPLRPARRTQQGSSTTSVIEGDPSSPTPHHSTSGYVPSISPTSALNPFYGYPVAANGGSPQLHHGRRRKRDLARTLARLFWLRWQTQIKVGAVLAAIALIVNFSLRRGLLRSPRIFLR
jgi:retinaldehyde-binding protein 1